MSLRAQINSGARFVSMAESGVSLQDVWSLTQNQAGLASLIRPALALAYEKRFIESELSTQTAIFALPYKHNVFGISFQQYGFSAYKEQKAGFTYARKFGNTLYTALNFNYHQIKITNYGSAQTYSLEAGIQYQFSKNLVFGTHISNPINNQFDQAAVGSTIPVNLQFGASYLFSDKVLIATAFEKTLNSNTDYKIGAEYNLIQWLCLRGGFSANPFKQYAGFGLNYSQFKLDMATSSHPVLGYSPQIAISYEF
ncbi:MAG: hypothetical protein WBP45_06970 [Daejeonella sp.]